MADDEDKISTLPEHVKHRILSLILDIKEVARTSLLSKSWQRTWRSFPITDFRPWLIMPREAINDIIKTGQGNAHSERFIRLVDDGLARSGDGMPRLGLYVTEDMLSHVERWVGLALDRRVEELIVEVLHNYLDKFFCSVPARVFSANSIKSLTLDGGIEIQGITSVSLPSLRRLEISFSRMDNTMFRRIIGGCPLLEDLTVVCCNPLSEIEVNNLNYLKTAKLGTERTDFKSASIKAQGLERLRFWYSSAVEQFVGFAFYASRSLTCLELVSIRKSDEWLCRFISGFPLLESLTLASFSTLVRIRISNPRLKNISITGCSDLEEIRIDAPELLSFYYKLSFHDSNRVLPLIKTTMSAYSCAAAFIISFERDPPEQWFQQIRKFLTGWSATFASYYTNVCLYENHSEFEDEDMKNYLADSAPGTEYMYFVSKAINLVNFAIMKCLFSTCRPTCVYLWVPYCIFELISKEFEDKDILPGYPDCCGEGTEWYMCFCHGLKGVQVDYIGGPRHNGPIEWRDVSSLLQIEANLTLEWWD